MLDLKKSDLRTHPGGSVVIAAGFCSLALILSCSRASRLLGLSWWLLFAAVVGVKVGLVSCFFPSLFRFVGVMNSLYRVAVLVS